MSDLFLRAINDLLALYMLALLIRWTAFWLEFDLQAHRWRWIPKITDPLIEQMRRILPPMGPMDFGPIAALLAVWLVRLLSWNLILGIGSGG